MNRLIIRSLVTALLLLVLLSVPSIASADSILWTLTGVVFSDGGTASGSFDFNAATGAYTNIAITTSGGTFSSSYSGFFGGIAGTSGGVLLGAPGPDFTGTDFLSLMFGANLTSAGGTIPLLPGAFDPVNLLTGSGETVCTNADCSTFSPDPPRLVTAGDVVGTSTVVTPEPTALSLLGVGLVALLAGAAIRKVSQA